MAETQHNRPKSGNPSFWRELFGGCHDLFWRWFGLDFVADEIKTHGNAVKKAAAIRFLMLISVGTGVIVYSFTATHLTSEHDKEEKASLKDYERKIDTRDLIWRGTVKELDDTKRERDKAQQELAPWMEFANKEFRDAPLNKRLDLLFDRADTLIEGMQESSKAIMQFEAANTDAIINTIKESAGAPKNSPIANQSLVGATFNAEVFVSSNEQANTNVFGGGFVGFGQGPKAILLASGPMYLKRQLGNDQVSYSLAFSADSSKISQDQILSSLLDADYLEISFVSMPKGSVVLGGKVVVVLNGNVRLQFDVPGQTTTEANAILIPDVKPELLRVLGQK